MNGNEEMGFSFAELIQDPLCLVMVLDALWKQRRVVLRDGVIFADFGRRQVLFRNGGEVRDITSFFLWLLREELGVTSFFV